jgi:hypothetical protein
MQQYTRLTSPLDSSFRDALWERGLGAGSWDPLPFDFGDEVEEGVRLTEPGTGSDGFRVTTIFASVLQARGAPRTVGIQLLQVFPIKSYETCRNLVWSRLQSSSGRTSGRRESRCDWGHVHAASSHQGPVDWRTRRNSGGIPAWTSIILTASSGVRIKAAPDPANGPIPSFALREFQFWLL